MLNLLGGSKSKIHCLILFVKGFPSENGHRPIQWRSAPTVVIG